MMAVLFSILIVCTALLYAVSRYLTWRDEARFPPNGSFASIAGVRLHYADLPAGADADLPAMVFIHGASGNLNDLKAPLAERLAGRGRMIFVDRPGHGHSARGKGSGIDVHLPDAQARLIAGLLEKLGIDRAIIIGHSYGGAVAAAFALDHPERTAGLVFLGPATHPWPGGGTRWYYRVGALPVIGPLFCALIAQPGGSLLYRRSVKQVFSPSSVPENYQQRSATRLALRPKTFQGNAEDVESLYAAVKRLAPRYREIDAPTAIVTGDRDDVVLADIHSRGLERDINGARLILLKKTGHMPAWSTPEKVIEAIEIVARRAAIDGDADSAADGEALPSAEPAAQPTEPALAAAGPARKAG